MDQKDKRLKTALEIALERAKSIPSSSASKSEASISKSNKSATPGGFASLDATAKNIQTDSAANSAAEGPHNHLVARAGVRVPMNLCEQIHRCVGSNGGDRDELARLVESCKAYDNGKEILVNAQERCDRRWHALREDLNKAIKNWQPPSTSERADASSDYRRFDTQAKRVQENMSSNYQRRRWWEFWRPKGDRSRKLAVEAPKMHNAKYPLLLIYGADSDYDQQTAMRVILIDGGKLFGIYKQDLLSSEWTPDVSQRFVRAGKRAATQEYMLDLAKREWGSTCLDGAEWSMATILDRVVVLAITKRAGTVPESHAGYLPEAFPRHSKFRLTDTAQTKIKSRDRDGFDRQINDMLENYRVDFATAIGNSLLHKDLEVEFLSGQELHSFISSLVTLIEQYGCKLGDIWDYMYPWGICTHGRYCRLDIKGQQKETICSECVSSQKTAH